MNSCWWETKEHLPRPEYEPDRDLTHQRADFHCAACGRLVYEVHVNQENFLCGKCRKKWNMK